MPSTYTSSLRLEQQAAGENLNTWGQPHLNNVIARADFSIAGLTTKALTADYSLTSSNTSDDEARAALLKFTGTGAYTVTIPSVSKAYYVQNAATGSLTITTGAGLTAVIPAGDTMPVFTDGTNVRGIVIGGLALKAYIDAQAFAATNLPGITPATAGQSVTNNGATASWADVYPPMTRVPRTSNTILGVADRGRYIDVTSGTFTQTVTAAATLGGGWWLDYGNSGTGTVTVDPNGAETIGGDATLTINPGEIYRVQSDASNLNVIPIKRSLGPHVIVQDQKASGVGGGTNVQIAWTTRTLNTVVANLAGASLAINQVTLPAGSWYIEASASFTVTSQTQIRIRNVTDGVTVGTSRAEFFENSAGSSGTCDAWANITITSPKAFSIEYYATLAGNLGLGGIGGEPGVFAEFRATRRA